MSRYGLAYYGVGYYGETSVDYSCTLVAESLPPSYSTDLGQVYLPGTNAPIGAYPDITYPATYVGGTPEPTEQGTSFYMLVRWTRPGGQWDTLRLVRGKYGTPDSEDDGRILLEATNDTGVFVDTTLTEGARGYYAIWVRETSTGRWFLSAATDAVNNKNYDGLTTLFNAVPRIFLSEDMQILGPVDIDSQMARWLQGYAFEHDYWRTLAESIVGDLHDIPLASAISWGLSIGLTERDMAGIGDRNLRRLLRASYRLSETKGTLNGIEGIASAATGWPTTGSVGANLMLDTDDSSAESSIGRWEKTNAALTRANVSDGSETYGALTVTLTTPLGSAITAPTAMSDYSLSQPLTKGLFVLNPTGTSATMNLAGTTDHPAHKYGIPVSPGTSYSFNLCWRVVTNSPNNTGSVVATITWYDRSGTAVGTTASSTSQNVSSSWQQTPTVTATSHADAAFAGITLSFTNTTASAFYHLDMMQFATSLTANKFTDARTVDLVISPTRINYCLNPSFGASPDGAAQWSAGTASATGGFVSTHCLSASNTEVASGVSTTTRTGTFSEGKPVTCSAYVNPTASGSSGTLTLTIEFLNSSGSVVTNGTITKNVTVTTGSYQRVSITATKAPANTSKVRFTLSGSGNLVASGASLKIDGVLIEKSLNLLTYFDASQDTTGFGGDFWAGSAHGSESLLYPGWLQKWPMLTSLLPHYAPQPVYVRKRIWKQSDIA